MDEDKIIADYVRQYYPKLIDGINFQAFKAWKIIGNIMNEAIEPLRILCSKLKDEDIEKIMKGLTNDEQ